ncbi:GNAT family N-acetyltransferase [Staphylococcus hominis]|uniref:GNAT family N-acetyltransferase n=1 Tax=Staphylococcus hominis TaxID=1290 RepID=UPI001642B0CC|nr:GNAT family N-acetyltransferase [Staphylococcus hominis]MBC2909844.1 GNAT family N-acetyltransferase [Staphylococcus hominis]MBC2911940.1 GNAT family N-acetyltransferase [Staphylococcus hominis]MBC2914159.1 GNAT family N-acetyltransferase [Staphylococcus hominis]MBC2936574.1 GNAT family N-acetyltransferase [Staphylococcus hominis]MBC2950806.1 GNAT family N-acetyltransferase [Staphylococcus hominis]
MAHIIREISIKDTEALTTLLTKIYDESDYTLYNPGEFNPSVSSISNLLERVITSPRNTIYVAEADDQLVGCIFVTTEKYERTQHEAIITLGVTKFYQKKGIGLALINAVEAWALNHNIKRLQASVVPENTHALMLLKGAGFNIEGELKNKLLINNQYFNKYIMAKLLL